MFRKLAMLLMFVSVVAVDVRSAEAQRPPGPRENFTVVASGETVILVDQREGRTWILAHSPTGGTPAWVPIQRFENPDEAEHWREEQRHFAEEREHEHREQQQREIRERLEDRRRQMLQHREEFEERIRRERERDGREWDRRQRDDDDDGDDDERDDDDDLEWNERDDDEREREASAPPLEGVREHLKNLGEQTQRGIMKSLEEHRQRMVEQFGKDHPAVKSIGEQIERLGRKLGEAPEASQPSAKKHDEAKSEAGTPGPQKLPLKKKADPDAGNAKAQTFAAAVRKAYPQLREELKTLEDTGADEARVKEIRDKIEILERLLKQIDEAEQKAGTVPKKKQAPESDKGAGAGEEARSDAKAKAEKGSAANAKLDEQLRDLRTQEQVLRETHGPQHPKVKQMQLKIAATQKMLDELNIAPRDASPVEKANRPPDRAEKPQEAEETHRESEPGEAESAEDQ